MGSGTADCPLRSDSFVPLVLLICLRSFYVFIKLVLKFKKKRIKMFLLRFNCRNVESFAAQKKSKSCHSAHPFGQFLSVCPP